MSSDIFIKVDTAYVEVGNITTNVNRMFRAAINVPMHFFNEVKCSDAEPFLEHALLIMKADPVKYKELEVSDWGAYDDFIPFLSQWLDKVRLHANGIIDCDH